MRQVLIYSILLLIGLGLSQVLPDLAGSAHDDIATAVRVLTMTGLAFIMIHVGFEFHIDKSKPRAYGWDYLVAFTAASFPWVLVVLYFVFVMLPSGFWSNFDTWKETLLAGRFAAPTSAGVLFSMLAAAGLGATQRLTRQLPWSVVMEPLLLGERIYAQRALSVGLTNCVVPAENVMPTAPAWAEQLTAGASLTQRAIKEAAICGLSLPLDECIRLEELLAAHIRKTDGFKEGPQA